MIKSESKAHGLTDESFDSMISCIKQAIIKDLKGIPQKSKMTVLKETIKRIETLRTWIAVKGEESVADEEKTIFDLVGGLSEIQKITDSVFKTIEESN